MPLHQFMDLETVNWIKENKPSFNIGNSLRFNLKHLIDNYLSEIKKYIPDPTWFLVSKKKRFDPRYETYIKGYLPFITSYLIKRGKISPASQKFYGCLFFT